MQLCRLVSAELPQVQLCKAAFPCKAPAPSFPYSSPQRLIIPAKKRHRSYQLTCHWQAVLRLAASCFMRGGGAYKAHDTPPTFPCLLLPPRGGPWSSIPALLRRAGRHRNRRHENEPCCAALPPSPGKPGVAAGGEPGQEAPLSAVVAGCPPPAWQGRCTEGSCCVAAGVALAWPCDDARMPAPGPACSAQPRPRGGLLGPSGWASGHWAAEKTLGWPVLAWPAATSE